VYIKNHSPTNALVGITPYEVLCGIKPVFSESLDAAPMLISQRLNLILSLEMCVAWLQCHSEGLSTLYDLERLKVFHSRDVVFDSMKPLPLGCKRRYQLGMCSLKSMMNQLKSL